MQKQSHRYPLVRSRKPVAAGEQRAVAHEIRVGGGLLGGETTGGIVFKHGFDQGDAVGLESGDKLAQVLALPLGEGRLEVGERADAGPVSLVGRAQDPKCWLVYMSPGLISKIGLT